MFYAIYFIFEHYWLLLSRLYKHVQDSLKEYTLNLELPTSHKANFIIS